MNDVKRVPAAISVGTDGAESVRVEQAPSAESDGAIRGELKLQLHRDTTGAHSTTALTGHAEGDLAGEVSIDVQYGIKARGSACELSASTGKISIARPDGRLEGVSGGMVDTASGEHLSITVWCGGTGRYTAARGYMHVRGVMDAQTGIERAHYEGRLTFEG